MFKQRLTIAALLTALTIAIFRMADAQDQTAPSTTPRTDDKLSSQGVRKQETTLGNLATDALRFSASVATQKPVDIAMLHADAFREGAINGEVTAGEIARLLPYPDNVVVLGLTKAQIERALEHSVEIYPRSSGAFLQVSGLQVAFDPQKPRGQRVTQVKVVDLNPAGRPVTEPLQPNKVYRVATTLSLASGASGYFTIFSYPRDKADAPANLTLQQAVERFVKESKAVRLPAPRIVPNDRPKAVSG